MTESSMVRRLAAFSQAIIPLALVALLALVGGLVLHTRTIQASHRATAENALRDYAALAAWQYVQQADMYLENTAHMTLSVVHPIIRRFDSSRALPAPDTLVRFGDTSACGIGGQARFAFRIDLPGRDIVFAGSPPNAAARAAIATRFANLAGSKPLSKEVLRMFVDTVGGEPRAIAYGVVRGSDSLPRAVYGVEATPAALVAYLEGIPKNKPLLPPSLVRGPALDSLLMVQVHRADGGVLVTLGAATDRRLAANERTSVRAGGLLTTVILKPEAASLLLIGGVPESRLTMLLFLLAGSAVLAGIALVQLRRSRDLARLRTRFVANVSHELRTPLAQISMFSETLLLGRERSRDEGQEFLSIIYREARRLSQLVESVLSFSRSEASPRQLQLEPHDVAGEVRDAVRAFTPLAAAAGVEIETQCEDGCIALLEPNALRQMLLNLIDNAVKFGPPEQRVVVKVSALENEVVVAIIDEGPGIPSSERVNVFRPFAQVATVRRRGTGVGIGLAVVAELVAEHNGRVWIDDGPGGGGTCVSIALPSAHVEPSSIEVVSPVVEEEQQPVLTLR